MSVSRRNWSALSSLARQRTIEDEEEVERERRRRVKSSSSTYDSEEESSAAPHGKVACKQGSESTPETSTDSCSAEQMPLDFMEILRVRDEKRRLRHMESLRCQKVVGDDDQESGGGGREELIMQQDKPTGHSDQPQNFSKDVHIHKSDIVTNTHQESGEPSGKDPVSRKPSDPTHKFVSSVSIALNPSPSASGNTTPVSPLSPKTPRSPQEQWFSPCTTPFPRGPRSPIPNGHATESSAMSPEATSKPIFVRKSSRTISFRMMRKKEEEISSLQRSASVRVASKMFESNPNEDLNEDKAPSFQRNSAQRVSSRSIQEKMERLAQAAQKSETGRSPDVSQRTLYLLDEVSRKRGLFEKEPQATCPISPSRNEIRSSVITLKDRINRWRDKTNHGGSSSSPTAFKHVDISSKKSLFEKP